MFPSGILIDTNDLIKATSVYGNLVLSSSTSKLRISPDHSYAVPVGLNSNLGFILSLTYPGGEIG